MLIHVAITTFVPQLLLSPNNHFAELPESERMARNEFMLEWTINMGVVSMGLMLLLSYVAARLVFLRTEPINGCGGRLATLSFLVFGMNLAASFPGCILVDLL